MPPLELWRLLLFYPSNSFLIMDLASTEGDWTLGLKLQVGTPRRGHWAGPVLSSGPGATKTDSGIPQ